MRSLTGFLICALSAAAQAQTPPAPPAEQDTCVDVQVGTAQSYDCLNRKLKQATQNTQRFSSDGSAPYNAGSPSNVTGQFNESATRNRLGTNFGKSAQPQRPVANFTSPFAKPH